MITEHLQNCYKNYLKLQSNISVTDAGTEVHWCFGLVPFVKLL